ncbi:MarR family winged helix-turn-helix transcriptional regulator [Kitasatospora sp. NPDC054939]
MNEAPASLLTLSSYLLSRTGKIARGRLAERLAERDLRLWHVSILAALSDFGPHSKSELASRLDISPSDIVKIVNDLVQAGQVECSPHPGDRRRVDVTITPAGRAELGLITAELAAVDEDVLAPLTAIERTLLTSLLHRLHQHIT